MTVPKRNAEIMLKKAAHYFSFVGQKIVPPRVSEALSILGLSETKDYEEEYTLEDANQDYQKWLASQGTALSGGEAAYKHIDDEGKVFQTVSMAWPNNKQAPREYFMPLQHPVVGKPCPVPAKGWRNPPGTMKKLLNQGRIVFGVNETTQPRRKYILEENMSENLASLLYYGSSDDASLKKMGIHFENPKPVEVAKRLMTGVVGNGDLVLDFFAGSGTAGQAIMEMNSESHKDVRFILVQIPERINEKHSAYKAGHKTIAELCIDRLEKAGRRRIEDSGSILDVGFRVYRLTESYFPENHFEFDPSKSEKENVAALRKHLETASQPRIFDKNEIADIITEISLKNGYGLFYTLEHMKRRFPGNTVYRLSGNGKGALLCLDVELQEKNVRILAERYPEDQLILSRRALCTAKNWTLRNAFGDNLRTV